MSSLRAPCCEPLIYQRADEVPPDSHFSPYCCGGEANAFAAAKQDLEERGKKVVY